MHLLLSLLVQWHYGVVMFPLDYQVLQTQLIINRLLVDELLHDPMIVEEARLELSVSVGFHQPCVALSLSVNEILRELRVVLHC